MEDTVFSFPGVAVWRQERLRNKSEYRDIRAPGRTHTWHSGGGCYQTGEVFKEVGSGASSESWGEKGTHHSTLEVAAMQRFRHGIDNLLIFFKRNWNPDFNRKVLWGCPWKYQARNC